MARALVLADEEPYVPLARLLEQSFDLVLCLGDLGHHDLAALERTGLPKLGVHGNHDDGDEFVGLGIEDVHLRAVDVAGMTIGGFSGAHHPRARGRFDRSQRESERMLRGFGRVDVMIAHSPPLGVNDDPDDPVHVGLSGLRAYVERCRPAMFLHGHTYPPMPVKRFAGTEIRHVRGHRIVELPGP